MTRRQWRADTGLIALFVSVNIHTTHHCRIRGVVLSPPICRGKQQWNYNECVRPALGRGWCHVYVPLCGVCLRSAISGARQELQSLVRGTASCTVMQCRDRVIVPSPGSGAGNGGAVVLVVALMVAGSSIQFLCWEGDVLTQELRSLVGARSVGWRPPLSAVYPLPTHPHHTICHHCHTTLWAGQN